MKAIIWGWGFSSVVERLPRKRKALGLVPSSEKKKRKLSFVLAEDMEVHLGVTRPVTSHVDISHSDLSDPDFLSLREVSVKRKRKKKNTVKSELGGQ